MKASSRRDNWFIVMALAVILGTLGLYVGVVYHWLSDAGPTSTAAPAQPQADPQKLTAARLAFRDHFLDARAWLRLADALLQAGRPVDGFYLIYGARQFFGDDAFFKAHALVVLKQDADFLAGKEYDPSPENERRLKTRLENDPNDAAALGYLARIALDRGDSAQAHRYLDRGLGAHPQNRSLLHAKAQLTALTDPLSAVPFYARLAHAGPDSYEGQRALEELGRLAQGREEGPRAEAVRLARDALDELKKANPGHPAIFTTLAMALWARGELAATRALVEETARKNAGHAGVAQLEGALALYDQQTDRAVKRFTAAWEKNPEDVYSAARLAQIYDKQRGEPEAALPFYITVYRRDPRRFESEPIEDTIRRILDHRRQQLVRGVGPQALGRFLASDDASLRAEACVRAAELKDPRWLETLAELLDDDAEIVRHNADYALYQLAKIHPEAVEIRRDDWLASNRPLLRARALNIFADLKREQTFPLVLRALQDQNPAVRYLAKTMVLDRYYADLPAAKRAAADYVAQEKNPAVLALYAPRAQP